MLTSNRQQRTYTSQKPCFLFSPVWLKPKAAWSCQDSLPRTLIPPVSKLFPLILFPCCTALQLLLRIRTRVTTRLTVKGRSSPPLVGCNGRLVRQVAWIVSIPKSTTTMLQQCSLITATRIPAISVKCVLLVGACNPITFSPQCLHSVYHKTEPSKET